MARMSIPTRAGIMSLLLPGLGQVYVNRIPRAIVWFVGLLILVNVLGREEIDRWIPLVFTGVLGVFSALDAVVVAKTAGPPRRS